MYTYDLFGPPQSSNWSPQRLQILHSRGMWSSSSPRRSAAHRLAQVWTCVGASPEKTLHHEMCTKAVEELQQV